MAFTYLITQTEFRDRISVLNHNLEIDRLVQHFRTVQELKLSEVLGTPLYDELVSQVSTSSITTDNEKLRSDYIAPYLSFQIFYEFAEQSYGQVTNTGAQKFNGVNTVPIETAYITSLKRQAGQSAMAYAERMIKYLNENRTKYPLWKGNCAAGVKPTNGGIFISPEHRRR